MSLNKDAYYATSQKTKKSNSLVLNNSVAKARTKPPIKKKNPNAINKK